MSGAVLLDLDGTLTDPFEGITRCHQHALQRMGVTPVPAQRDLARFIGPPLREAFASLLGPAAGRDAIERAVSFYRERFSSIGLFENVVYDGIEPMLADLVAAGCTLFVATSKLTPFAERILRHFELRRFFAGVYGADPDGRFDDKRELVCDLLDREKLAPATTVMVGDREHDVRAAKHNGLRSVGVTWGYGTIAELVAAGADCVCAHPGEVVAALRAGAVASRGSL
jgi:phosphoglycolate phosphatase